jgi:hypothetical protein
MLEPSRSRRRGSLSGISSHRIGRYRILQQATETARALRPTRSSPHVTDNVGRAHTRGSVRVVFVNGENLGGIGIGATDTDTTYREEVTPAARLVSAMRSETARMLREELNVMDVDVCEVVTGESRIRAPAMTGPTTKEASNPVRAHGTEDQPLQVPPAPEQ